MFAYPAAWCRIARAFRRHCLTPEGRPSVAGLVRGYRLVHERAVACIKRRFARLRGVGQRSLYGQWMALHEGFASSPAAQRIFEGEHFSRKPLISLLMPVYRVKEAWLRRAIESVLNQSYQRWQLCIVDDCSEDGGIRKILGDYAARDARIQVLYRAERGHIARASNDALQCATGEFVAFLDHDDELAKQALYRVVEAIDAHPDVGLLYSDEDKIDARGRRSDPHFKPDWNPELLRCQNYVCHLLVVRRDLAEAVGGLRVGYEGAQDHDLVLRVSERLEPRQIRHIPHVLYHWRMISGSTAASAAAKEYATSAAQRAISDHVARLGLAAEVLPAPRQLPWHRVRYGLPAPTPHVTLIVPTRDRCDLLRRSIESILRLTTYRAYDLIVVDNNSREKSTKSYLKSLLQQHAARVSVLTYGEPFNFSRINNVAAARARGSILGLINNDIEVISPDWLDEMVRLAARPENGCVGAKLYYPDGRIQHGGVILGIGGVAGHAHKMFPRDSYGYMGRLVLPHNLSAVTGACLLVRKSVYQEVGGLEEGLAVAFNDVDFCLKVLQRGYRNVWTPLAELYHHESASRGVEVTQAQKRRFETEVHYMLGKWNQMLLTDPAYNINLTLEHENFSYNERLGSGEAAHAQ